MDIEKKVKQIIMEQFEVGETEVKDDARFIEDLKADSIAIYELIMKLEEEFDLKIPDEDMKELTTVGKAIEYIKKKKS
uniref:Acyl carrier protein n=1 Tax=candidate division WOR-3 bacterium TaxID=2052148 RepID=A0A7C4Y584_UNCW3